MSYKVTDVTINEYKIAHRSVDDYIKEFIKNVDIHDFTPDERLRYSEALNKLYKPTDINAFDLVEEPSCSNCTNNPKIGGSGICNCILGSQVICQRENNDKRN